MLQVIIICADAPPGCEQAVDELDALELLESILWFDVAGALTDHRNSETGRLKPFLDKIICEIETIFGQNLLRFPEAVSRETEDHLVTFVILKCILFCSDARD